MFPPPIEIIFSLFLESKPGDLYMFHSLDRHGVTVEVSCTVDMRLTVVKSSVDANVFHLDAHARFVVLVKLP